MSSDNMTDLQTCPQCRAEMTREMRFCRQCGYRLGESVAEYTETRRFDGNLPQGATAPLPPPNQTNPTGWGQVPQPGAAAPAPVWQPRQSKRGMHWMVWVVVGLVASSAISGVFLGRSGPRISVNKKASVPRSHVGVDNFDNADNKAGVTFDVVEPPDSPADKAGLVGGDIIVSFDGQTVTNHDQLTNLLTATPIGKTVEIVYLRDGERKTTKMTTASEEEIDRLEEVFDAKEHGQFGIDNLDRVPVAGANIYGVRIGEVYNNRPAYLAGLKEGDIIVEINDTPIRTEEELSMRIDRAAPLSTAKVVVMRGPKEGPLEKLTIEVKVGKD